ncbi:MAG TPA: hypothetical protein DIT58_15275 [Porticoccaceae bacterium]|nr:hypothetical protein [Porticoccaceae bacterium]
MNPIQFRKDVLRGSHHDPRNALKLTPYDTEIRYDPLTGRSSRICHFSSSTRLPKNFEQLVESTQKHCPFCPERILRETPRFDESLLPEGRLRLGEAVLFPNLNPYDELSAVIVPCRAHYFPANELPVKIVVDGIRLARDFLALLEHKREGAYYGSFYWNYLPPSGGSQIHPHMHVLYSTAAPNLLRERLAAEKQYFKQYRRTYQQDLCALEEEQGERWVGSTGTIHWHTPFAPTGLLGDLMATFPKKKRLTELNDEDITEFAHALRAAMQAFSNTNLWSFNLAFYPQATGIKTSEHWLAAHLVPRLYIAPGLHSADVSFMQLLLDEKFATVYPEQVAKQIKNVFKEQDLLSS